MRRVLMGSLAFAALASFTSMSSAHITLISPTSRYPGDGPQKTAPCGAPGDARGSNITRFAPGQKITVQWDETIDHPGHYRIMFDADGQDDFPIPTGENDICDPASSPGCLADNIPDRNGGVYSIDVTLPDIECDNCTLQLIQMMTDRNPPTMYYRCADIVIEGSGTGGPSGSVASSGGGPDQGATTSTGGAQGTGGGAQGTGGGAQGTGGGAQGTGGGPGGSDDDGGCSFGARGAPATAGLAALALLSLWARGRRRGASD